jgi:excisionase family DNA binding protein
MSILTSKRQAMSVGTLADALGVSRQRVYTLIKQGKIHAVPMAGGSVVLPQEVDRILASAVRVNVKGVNRLRLDFSAI